MEWLQLSIYTTSEGIEPVSGRLYALGINGIEIEDERDFFEFLENNRDCWDYVDDELIESKKGETRVKVYITNNASGLEQLAAIRSSMSELKEYDRDGRYGRLVIDSDTICEEDWANNWKRFFHPIEIGERLLICPEWEVPEDSGGRTVFRVNPGMTFGTGSHYTTQLCIEQLEKYVTPGTDMLDLGCGSGILSVIALMLGADSAYAVDIDPNCKKIAYENAARNGVDKEKYTVVSGNVLTDEKLREKIGEKKYGVIAANIVADVIIGLVPAAREYLAAGGVFITSGIIADREADVSAALKEHGFEIKEILRRGEWVCMVCV